MNYITCVDEIVKGARQKIVNAAYLDAEDFNDISDYLKQRVDAMLEDIRKEFDEFEDQYDVSP